jgi:hypothetical protein
VLIRARGNESLLAVSGNQIEHLWTEKVVEDSGISNGLSRAR